MSGAVPWQGWKTACRSPDIRRRGDPQAADQAGGEVGEDVPQQVLRDENVEPLGPADELHRRGIDVKMIGRDVGEPGRDLVEDLAEEGERAEDVGLVHAA